MRIFILTDETPRDDAYRGFSRLRTTQDFGRMADKLGAAGFLKQIEKN
jgi:hypothetical protein